MDTLIELKRFYDMMAQYREAIKKWENEPLPTLATTKGIREFRTQLQRNYARLEEEIAKYGGTSSAKNPLSGVKQDIFEVAFDGFSVLTFIDRLNALDQAVKVVNRAIGKLEAEGESWRVRAHSPEMPEQGRTCTVGPSRSDQLPPPTIRIPLHDDASELTPAFAWYPVDSAIAYDFVLAEALGQHDPFAIIEYSATTGIPSHISRKTLKFDTTYNWRVRAVSTNARGPWTASSFTTVSEQFVRSLQNRASFAQVIAVLQTPVYAQPKCQFEKAVRLLTQNPPDNENAFKDAVAAVEGVANIVAGTSGQQLNTVINRLVAVNKIPKPSDGIFKMLYARRGAAPGVAHSNVTAATALTNVEVSFLLGVCAECIRYLVQLR